jgi:hypothetical protein
MRSSKTGTISRSKVRQMRQRLAAADRFPRYARPVRRARGSIPQDACLPTRVRFHFDRRAALRSALERFCPLHISRVEVPQVEQLRERSGDQLHV